MLFLPFLLVRVIFNPAGTLKIIGHDEPFMVVQGGFFLDWDSK